LRERCSGWLAGWLAAALAGCSLLLLWLAGWPNAPTDPVLPVGVGPDHWSAAEVVALAALAGWLALEWRRPWSPERRCSGWLAGWLLPLLGPARA